MDECDRLLFYILKLCIIITTIRMNMRRNSMDNKNHYFPVFLMLGTCLGLLFDNLPLFMCIGLALGLVLGKNQKNK